MNKIQKLLYLLLGIIFFLLLSILSTGFINKVKIFSTVLGNIATLLYIIILFYYVVLYHTKVNRISSVSYITFRFKDIILFLYGGILCIIALVIQLIIINICKVSEISINTIISGKLLEAFFNKLIISSLEELFFRALIFVALLKIFNKLWVPLIVSSIFFALIHINGLPKLYIGIGVINLFIGGCLLAYIYYVTNSIWSAIGFHWLHNMMNVVIDVPDNLNVFILNTLVYLILFMTLLVLRNYIFTNQRKVLSV